MSDSQEFKLNLLDLPTEILEKIIVYCPLPTLPSLSATCKYLHGILSSDHLWRIKWKTLVNSSNITLDEPLRTEETQNYFHCARRLLGICYRPEIGITSFEPEHDCTSNPCSSTSSKCKENEEKKFAIDIGSKITWIMTSGYFLERHPSVLAIPTSDTIFESSKLKSNNPVRCLLCHDSNKSKKNVLGPQLIKTEQLKLDATLEIDLESINVDQGVGSNAMAGCSSQAANFLPLPRTSNPLMRPKFTLWSEISFMLRDAKIEHDIFHPSQCFFEKEDFKYLELYITHLIQKLNMSSIKKANASLIFCEPFNSNAVLREKLAKFFMETLQAKRICFLNKSLATSLLFLSTSGTCVVIDSGARNTVISIIIEGVVQNDRVQHCPIGGTEIAQYLADAIKLKGLKNDVYVPSLDSDRVKSRCYLALNPNLEEKRGGLTKRKVFVRCVKDGPGPHLEEIRLGSELYCAPELMYTAMDVTRRLKTALSGLEPKLVKECLSNVILTGSNTELKGFSTRLARDLQTAFPQHNHSIFLKSNSGSHSWDAVTGAMYVPILYRDPMKLTESFWPPNKSTPGSIVWVTREDYILHGNALFN